MEIVNTLYEEEWSEFVTRKQESNIFHTLEMYQVFSKTQNFYTELWASVNKGRILALLMPVYINLFSSPLLRKITTRAVCFGSALFDDGQEGRQALRYLLSEYSAQARKKAIFTELRNICEYDSLRPLFYQCGFRFEDHLNFLINLEASHENVFKRVGARTRKNLKRAIRKNLVEIEEVKDPGKLSICYDLLKNTYRRPAIPLADFSLFKAAFEILLPKKMIRISLASVKGQAVAVSFDLLYKKTIYAWYGGVDRRYGSFLPNELLTWDILRWGCLNGFELYDFGGAGRPGQKYGVRSFKAKFGGQMVNYGRFVNIHSKLIYYLDIAFYNVLRHILFRKK